jgi:hypothetical protein
MLQSLDTVSRPVLFFGGPRRRDAPGHQPREARKARRMFRTMVLAV